MFIVGMTPYSIAKELTRLGIPTPGGKENWAQTTVKSILTNEKYKGDALLQKSYIVDFLTKKQKKNEGEVPQYYVENNHEGIITLQIFAVVQDEFNRRSQSKGKYSGVGMFSAKIKCGECGGWYGAKVWHSNDKYRRVVYRCNHKFKNTRKKCGTPHLTEDEIKELFIMAVNKLLSEKDELVCNLELIRQTLCNNEALEQKQRDLQAELAVVVEMTQAAVTENARTALNQEEYQERYYGLVDRYDKLKAQHEKLAQTITENIVRSEQLTYFAQTIQEQNSAVTEFDEILWGSLVETVTVHGKDDVIFTFKDGSEIRA